MVVNFFLAATTALPWHVHGPRQARSSAHSNHRPTFPHSSPLRAHAAVPAAAAQQPLPSRGEQGLSLPKMGLNITHDLIFIFTKGGVFLSVF